MGTYIFILRILPIVVSFLNFPPFRENKLKKGREIFEIKGKKFVS